MVYESEVNGIRRSHVATTGDYRLVAAMVIAGTDLPLPQVVTVWAEKLLPDYGPYKFLVHSDEFGNLKVANVLTIRNEKEI